MSLDLELLVVDGELKLRPYSHTILSLDRTGIAHVIRDEVQEKHGSEFENDGLYCHFADIQEGENEGQHCYGFAQETPFGDPIYWVHAKRLKPFKDHADVTTSRFNKAAWAYICALPDDVRIGLYFH